MTSNGKSNNNNNEKSNNNNNVISNNNNNIDNSKSDFYAESLFLAKLENSVLIIKRAMRKILKQPPARPESLSPVEKSLASSLSHISNDKLSRLNGIFRMLHPQGVTKTSIIVNTKDVELFAVSQTHPLRYIFNIIISLYEIRQGHDVSTTRDVDIPISSNKNSDLVSQSPKKSPRKSLCRKSNTSPNRRSKRASGSSSSRLTTPRRGTRSPRTISRPRISPRVVPSKIISTHESLVTTPNKRIHTRSITSRGRDSIHTKKLTVAQTQTSLGNNMFCLSSSITRTNIRTNNNNNNESSLPEPASESEPEQEQEQEQEQKEEEEEEDEYEDNDEYGSDDE